MDDWRALELRGVRRDAIRRLVRSTAGIADEFRTCMIQWQGDNIIGKVGIPTVERARLYNAIDDLRRVLDMDEPPVNEAAE